ncbi:MAG: bifunctional glycosyltransferase family 2/GtrA family protein [Candidatus Paceibacterota bacterium]
MKNNISLSIFFPAYNEESNIAQSVAEAEQSVKKITDTYEIIIINDGSSDGTREIAEWLAWKNPRVRVIHHEKNQGYGAAVLSGIQAARYDYVFFTDADLQFDLAELSHLTRFAGEYDAVLGYRARRKDSFMRKLNAKGWNILNQFFFGLKVDDIDCAFKLLDRKRVSALPIQSRGAMVSAEILIQLEKSGATFKEVPVTHLPRKSGVQTGAHPKVIMRAFSEMFKVFRGDLGRPVRSQLMRFASIGFLCTAIDVGSYIGLTRSSVFFAENMLLTKVLTFLLGSMFSFALNRMWTFQYTGKLSLAQFGRFYATVGSAVFVNVTSVYIIHTLMGLHDIVAVILATGITFVWNFVLTKVWVFNNKPQRTQLLTAESLLATK